MLADVHVQSIHYFRVFLWLRIGRALGCAMAPTALLLSLGALLILQLFRTAVPLPVSPTPVPQVRAVENTPTTPLVIVSAVPVLPETISEGLTALFPPLAQVLLPLTRISSSVTGTGWTLLNCVSAFGVWTAFGVAIARCTAVQICREAGPSFRQSVQWSWKRLPASLASLLTPLGFMAVLCLGIFLLLLPGTVPLLRAIWLPLIAPVCVLLGLLIAALVLLLPILWTLVVAAVAIDDSDAFDAFSRSFSFMTSRPWTLLSLVGVMAVTTSVVAAGLWMVEAKALALLGLLNEAIISEVWNANLAEHFAAWSKLLLTAALSSLFWAHATILYLFLRHAVDGTPLDALAGFEDDSRFHEPFPVVGIPAVTTPPSPSAVTPTTEIPEA